MKPTDRTTRRQWLGYVLFLVVVAVLATATVVLIVGALMRGCATTCP